MSVKPLQALLKPSSDITNGRVHLAGEMSNVCPLVMSEDGRFSKRLVTANHTQAHGCITCPPLRPVRQQAKTRRHTRASALHGKPPPDDRTAAEVVDMRFTAREKTSPTTAGRHRQGCGTLALRAVFIFLVLTMISRSPCRKSYLHTVRGLQGQGEAERTGRGRTRLDAA